MCQLHSHFKKGIVKYFPVSNLFLSFFGVICFYIVLSILAVFILMVSVLVSYSGGSLAPDHLLTFSFEAWLHFSALKKLEWHIHIFPSHTHGRNC